MTLDADHLRALSDLVGPERAFLTVYLDAADDPSVLDARFVRIRSLLADQPDETEHFEQNLAVVARLLDETPAPPGGAVAAFAGWAADLAKAYELPEPVGTRVWMGDAPYVRPAYELLEEHETFAVAVVDNTSAQIFYVAPGEVDEEGRVRGDVKNRVKKGGWSQKRYARRREKQIEQYASEIAGDLQALDRERPFARLVLLGSDEPVQAVRAALPAPLVDKLVGTRSVDAHATEAELIEEAGEVAEAGERKSEEDLWAAIREQGVGPGLAAFGATAVLDALRQARAEAVLVDREAEIAGTKCRDCGHVAHGTPRTCGVCGSRDVFRVDLVEHMTEQAVRTGAEVDFTDPFPALADAGGVAALLRYALRRADPEQEERERRAAEASKAPIGDGADTGAAPPVPATTDPEGATADDAGADSDTAPAVDEPDDAKPLAAEPPSVEPVTAETVPAVAGPTPPVDARPEATPDASPPRPRTSARRATDRPAPAPPVAAESPVTPEETPRGGVGWVWIGLAVLAVLVVLLLVLLG